MGRRPPVRGDRLRASADREEGMAEPLFRSRHPPPQQARRNFLPHLAGTVLFIWFATMLVSLSGGLDSICPSCTRMYSGIFKALHPQDRSTGVHVQMKYGKSASDRSAGRWARASTLPLTSFATADGEDRDPLLPRARGPHRGSLPGDQQGLEGASLLAWDKDGARRGGLAGQKSFKAKKVFLGGLAKGSRSPGTARFSKMEQDGEGAGVDWDEAWADDSLEDKHLQSVPEQEGSARPPQIDYIQMEQERTIADRSSALLRSLVPHLLHGTGLDASLVQADDPALPSHGPGSVAPHLVLHGGKGGTITARAAHAGRQNRSLDPSGHPLLAAAKASTTLEGKTSTGASLDGRTSTRASLDGRTSAGASLDGRTSAGNSLEVRPSEASNNPPLTAGKVGGSSEDKSNLYGGTAPPKGSTVAASDDKSRVYSRTQPTSADIPGGKLSSGASMASSGLQNPLNMPSNGLQNPLNTPSNGLQNPQTMALGELASILHMASNGLQNPSSGNPKEALGRGAAVQKQSHPQDERHPALSTPTQPAHSASQQSASSADGRILPGLANLERPGSPGYRRKDAQGTDPLEDLDLPLVASPPPHPLIMPKGSSGPATMASQVLHGVPSGMRYPSPTGPRDQVGLEAVGEGAGRPATTTPGARPGSEQGSGAFEHGEEVQKHILEELDRLEREPDRDSSKDGPAFPWDATFKTRTDPTSSTRGRSEQEGVALPSNRHDGLPATGGHPASAGGAKTGNLLKGDPILLTAQTVERLLNRGGAQAAASLEPVPELESTRVAEREAADAVAKTKELASAEAVAKSGAAGSADAVAKSGALGSAEAGGNASASTGAEGVAKSGAPGSAEAVATSGAAGSAEAGVSASASSDSEAEKSVPFGADGSARTTELAHGAAVPQPEYPGTGVPLEDLAIAVPYDPQDRKHVAPDALIPHPEAKPDLSPPYDWGEPAPPSPQGPQTAMDIATRPVHVVLMTGHFFGGQYARVVPNCTFQGRPLHCQYHADTSRAAQLAADALWYHLPSYGWVGELGEEKIKPRPEQLTVAMSMESEVYYNSLANERFMKKFDVEMTYRPRSQVMVPYFQPSYMHDWEAKPPLPTNLKKNAIAYMNSNCGAVSGRGEIMAWLMENGSIPVHSYGGCQNNMGRSGWNKIEVFHQYKFCVCMENSLAESYVTEKIYDGLVAGCLPIYYGAPDIADFVPDVNGIIDYRNFGSPAALLEELMRLSNDDAAYEAAMAWHYRPRSQLSPQFQRFLERAGEPHTQCRLCRYVAQHRLNMSVPGTPPPAGSAVTLYRRRRVV